MATVAETIRDITRQHLLERNGLLFAQNVMAVGWIGNTVPSDLPGNKGIVELPTSDCSNPGIVVGAALMGCRPIYVIRYQGFLWYNLATLVNYAAKSKELWGKPCPIFIRALAMEGHMGPVAGNLHHSMAMRMPGIKVAAPMTPGEYRAVWDDFMAGDDPVLCSESRLSFGNIDEMGDVGMSGSVVTLFGISAARLNVAKAWKALWDGGIESNVHSVVWLRPFIFSCLAIDSLRRSKFGVVVDGDYEESGAARSIAYELTHLTGKPVYALGLEDRTAGFSAATDNRTPSPERIVEFVRSRL